MICSNRDSCEPSAANDAVHEAKHWKAIAEEASKEQDGAKLLELTNRLIAALDQQTTA